MPNSDFESLKRWAWSDPRQAGTSMLLDIAGTLLSQAQSAVAQYKDDLSRAVAPNWVGLSQQGWVKGPEYDTIAGKLAGAQDDVAKIQAYIDHLQSGGSPVGLDVFTEPTFAALHVAVKSPVATIAKKATTVTQSTNSGIPTWAIVAAVVGAYLLLRR